MFRSEQIIFTSGHNITKLLVPADGTSYIQEDFSDVPSIFFTISDPTLDGGSCIYVLEDLAAYEILEGGRDSTSDYSTDRSVYFGSKDGIYKYDAETLSAKKFGPFRDDIIQLQKANGSDTIYILTAKNKIYKIENNGTVKSRIQSVTCALEFVLDTSNNLYFISCDDSLPRIVKPNGNLVTYVPSVTGDFKEIKLIRPAFLMENSIPLFADGWLHVLYENGSSEKKDFYINEHPTACSVDAALYLVLALNGKIFEFNVMEAMLTSMFGYSDYMPIDLTKMIMSIIQTTKEGVLRNFNSADK
ncbi:uncharacterized protein [Maniola hyperantus]|uniref:uncharacterized protein n=1 Tax=Aphantopus hyperantus TaxID=2795564 RepID=UPI003749E3DF